MSITILGIESSCDDTSAAVIRDGLLLSNVIASQSVHEEYGGVVPELASRAHQQNIVPVVAAALSRAGIDKHDLSAIAVSAYRWWMSITFTDMCCHISSVARLMTRCLSIRFLRFLFRAETVS